MRQLEAKRSTNPSIPERQTGPFLLFAGVVHAKSQQIRMKYFLITFVDRRYSALIHHSISFNLILHRGEHASLYKRILAGSGEAKNAKERVASHRLALCMCVCAVVCLRRSQLMSRAGEGTASAWRVRSVCSARGHSTLCGTRKERSGGKQANQEGC